MWHRGICVRFIRAEAASPRILCSHPVSALAAYNTCTMTISKGRSQAKVHQVSEAPYYWV